MTEYRETIRHDLKHRLRSFREFSRDDAQPGMLLDTLEKWVLGLIADARLPVTEPDAGGDARIADEAMRSLLRKGRDWQDRAEKAEAEVARLRGAVDFAVRKMGHAISFAIGDADWRARIDVARARLTAALQPEPQAPVCDASSRGGAAQGDQAGREPETSSPTEPKGGDHHQPGSVSELDKNQPAQGDVSVPASDMLPCDVLLPPGTRIAAGCSLATLHTAIEHRRTWPDPNPPFTRPSPTSDLAKVRDALKALPQSIIDKFIRELKSWGDQCVGGAGDTVNPVSGLRYGHVYYAAAEALASLGDG